MTVCQFRFLDGHVENHRVRPCRGEDLPRIYTLSIVEDKAERSLFGEMPNARRVAFERRTFRHPDLAIDQFYYQEV